MKTVKILLTLMTVVVLSLGASVSCAPQPAAGSSKNHTTAYQVMYESGYEIIDRFDFDDGTRCYRYSSMQKGGLSCIGKRDQ